jgi:hypothetical protein
MDRWSQLLGCHAMALGVLVLGSSGACAQAPRTTARTLSSGRTIRVIAIGPMHFQKSPPALVLSYQTDLRIDDAEALRGEVAEIWRDFQKDADSAKVDSAIIMANEVPTGRLIQQGRSFNFVFQRNADGTWPLTPEDVGAQLLIENATVGNAGLFQIDGSTAQQAPGTAAGAVHMGGTAMLLAATDRVPRKRGTAFGYQFVVQGQPKGAVVSVRVVVLHPAVQAPGTASTSERDSWDQKAALGVTSYAGWRFDEPWEMAPGKWTIQVFHESRLLAAREFTVE